MRIISGKYKGKKITIPKQFRSRPTTDFAKENLFNIISNYFDFEEINVLELFAGTGSISFEFASRGCSNIDLVEADSRICIFISKVAADLDPLSPEAHYGLGTAYLKLKRDDEAITEYLRTIKSDKNFIQTYEPLGNLFLKQGKKEDALIIFRSLLTIDPEYPERKKIENVIKQLEAST